MKDIHIVKKFQEFYKTSGSIAAFTVTLPLSSIFRFTFLIHFKVTFH